MLHSVVVHYFGFVLLALKIRHYYYFVQRLFSFMLTNFFAHLYFAHNQILLPRHVPSFGYILYRSSLSKDLLTVNSVFVYLKMTDSAFILKRLFCWVHNSKLTFIFLLYNLLVSRLLLSLYKPVFICR